MMVLWTCQSRRLDHSIAVLCVRHRGTFVSTNQLGKGITAYAVPYSLCSRSSLVTYSDLRFYSLFYSLSYSLFY